MPDALQLHLALLADYEALVEGEDDHGDTLLLGYGADVIVHGGEGGDGGYGSDSNTS